MPERIRVLHVLATLSGGGAEGLVASLVPLLNTSAVEARVMTIYPSALPADWDAQATPVFAVDRAHRYDLAFFARMVRMMREWRPTVVHTHMHNGKYWGRLAALVAGVPIVVHTVHDPSYTHRLPIEKIADRVLNWRTKAIVTFLERHRRFLSSFEHIPESKIVVIPNGIVMQSIADEAGRIRARAALAVPDEMLAILVVGRLQQLKNQHLAVQTMAALSAAVSARVVMYVIGAGPDAETLKDAIDRAGLVSKVHLLGFRSDVWELLAGGDLLFVPSLIEGMPLAVLEGLSAGLPVLTTPWGGVDELLDDGRWGTILADWDPASGAEGIARVLDDLDRVRAMAEAARGPARDRYDIRNVARMHESLYLRLLRSPAL